MKPKRVKITAPSTEDKVAILYKALGLTLRELAKENPAFEEIGRQVDEAIAQASNNRKSVDEKFQEFLDNNK